MPAGGFMAPDEASSLSIMHGAVVLYRLCRCAEYILSPINQLQRLHGTILLSVDYKKVETTPVQPIEISFIFLARYILYKLFIGSIFVWLGPLN